MSGSKTDTVPVPLSLADETATVSLAENLARISQPGDILALWGTLGTGKTVFARAFIRALGEADEEVPSPTFTLVQAYDTATATIHHFDLFRLDAPDEAYELGIEEAFADGISLIEWPDKLGGLLPRNRLDIDLTIGDAAGVRHVELTGPGDWMSRLKEAAIG
ncbi:MAG: tRNA (adenosine(37)-N6)-threonylcarbamoyltransferase complex ATPase subunit type 1 TsaE [Rhodospirillales bacterium]|nr:tRNA (adenosine(37)-N6)-threonylcarbamoyltransferase complex ATPase subunit type 1 TsaE [Rhodospirillales bacterium]